MSLSELVCLMNLIALLIDGVKMANIKNKPRVSIGLIPERGRTYSIMKGLDYKLIGAIFIGTTLFILIVIAMTTEWFSWINIKKLFE